MATCFGDIFLYDRDADSDAESISDAAQEMEDVDRLVVAVYDSNFTRDDHVRKNAAELDRLLTRPGTVVRQIPNGDKWCIAKPAASHIKSTCVHPDVYVQINYVDRLKNWQLCLGLAPHS